MAAEIIGSFEPVLKSNLILAAFIPLIVYLSAAVGTQTQTLFIRDLVVKVKLPLLQYFMKQIVITGLIALLFGLIIFLSTIFLWQLPYLCLVVGLATTI